MLGFHVTKGSWFSITYLVSVLKHTYTHTKKKKNPNLLHLNGGIVFALISHRIKHLVWTVTLALKLFVTLVHEQAVFSRTPEVHSEWNRNMELKMYKEEFINLDITERFGLWTSQSYLCIILEWPQSIHKHLQRRKV